MQYIHVTQKALNQIYGGITLCMSTSYVQDGPKKVSSGVFVINVSNIDRFFIIVAQKHSATNFAFN